MEMSDERIVIVMQAIHKYINKYYDASFINYYDIFGIDASLSSERIETYIKEKRYKALFHPDNIYNIPEHLRAYYEEICEMWKNFYAILSTPYKKAEYDSSLVSSQVNFKEEEKKQKEEPTQEYHDDDDLRKTREEFYKLMKKRNVFDSFGRYLLPNLAKYGKVWTINAVSEYLKSRYLKGFTNTQDSRSKIASVHYDTISEKILDAYGIIGLDEISKMLVEDCISFSANKLSRAAEETYLKYGIDQTRAAIKKLLTENKFTSFTNNSNVRFELQSSEVTGFTLPYLLAYEEDIQEYLQKPQNQNLSMDYIIDDYLKIIANRATYGSYDYVPK